MHLAAEAAARARVGVRVDVVVHVADAATRPDGRAAMRPAAVRLEDTVVPVTAGVADPAAMVHEGPGRRAVVVHVGRPVSVPHRNVAGTAPVAVAAARAEVVEPVGVFGHSDIRDAGIVGGHIVRIGRNRCGTIRRSHDAFLNASRTGTQEAQGEYPRQCANPFQHRKTPFPEQVILLKLFLKRFVLLYALWQQINMKNQKHNTFWLFPQLSEPSNFSSPFVKLPFGRMF